MQCKKIYLNLNQCSVRFTTLTASNVFHSSLYLHVIRLTFIYPVGLGLYFSLEWIALINRGCVTSNVWKSRLELLRLCKRCRCNDQGELCVCSKLTRQHEFNSDRTTQQFVKSGQIRDARPKTGQIGIPGDL